MTNKNPHSKWREIKLHRNDRGTAHEKATLLSKFKTVDDQTRGVPVKLCSRDTGHEAWDRPGVLRISNIDDTPEIYCRKPWTEVTTGMKDTSTQWVYGCVSSDGTIALTDHEKLTWEYAD